MKRIDDVECARSLAERAREAEQNEETAKAKGLYDDALAQFADDFLGAELDFLRPGLPLVVLGQFSYIVSIATLTIAASDAAGGR